MILRHCKHNLAIVEPKKEENKDSLGARVTVSIFAQSNVVVAPVNAAFAEFPNSAKAGFPNPATLITKARPISQGHSLALNSTKRPQRSSIQLARPASLTFFAHGQSRTPNDET